MKKGFTLIELLAVIIILAIISLIAIPMMLEVIEDVKKSTGLSEANMILNGINNYCATEDIKYQMDNSYEKICNRNLTINQIYEMVNKGTATIIEFEYTNKLSWLKIKSNNYIYSLQNDVMVEGNFEKPLPSFANDSWETIIGNIRSGNSSVYNVGDEKEISLEGYTNGADITFTIRLANNSTPMECETEGFSQTACGFVIEFVDVITDFSMNSTNTNLGGWPASKMNTFLNNDIYNSLPSELQKYILETFVVSGHGSSDSANFTSNGKLYLLSTKEVWGKDGATNIIELDSAEIETRQLDYYKMNNVTTNNYLKTAKTYQGNSTWWWLRTAVSNSNSTFFRVYSYGTWTTATASSSKGVAPAFRIG